jgi:hypothetical protein
MCTPSDPLTDVSIRRAMAGIHRKVVKHGKRNALYRFILAKGDKEKIAAWKQDFARVLHIFNVRSIGFVGHSRTYWLPFRPSW